MKYILSIIISILIIIGVLYTNNDKNYYNKEANVIKAIYNASSTFSCNSSYINNTLNADLKNTEYNLNNLLKIIAEKNQFINNRITSIKSIKIFLQKQSILINNNVALIKKYRKIINDAKAKQVELTSGQGVEYQKYAKIISDNTTPLNLALNASTTLNKDLKQKKIAFDAESKLLLDSQSELKELTNPKYKAFLIAEITRIKNQLIRLNKLTKCPQKEDGLLDECYDGRDNDGNGLTDCDDKSCNTKTRCVTQNSNSNNNISNNNGGENDKKGEKNKPLNDYSNAYGLCKGVNDGLIKGDGGFWSGYSINIDLPFYNKQISKGACNQLSIGGCNGEFINPSVTNPNPESIGNGEFRFTWQCQFSVQSDTDPVYTQICKTENCAVIKTDKELQRESSMETYSNSTNDNNINNYNIPTYDTPITDPVNNL